MKISASLQKIQESKKAIRRLVLLERTRLASAKRRQASGRICRVLKNLPEARKAKVVAVFLPWRSEVDLSDFIQSLVNRGRTVLIPDTRLGLSKTKFHPFRPGDQLQNGRFGPRELSRISNPYDFKAIDLLVIPGLAFDRRKGRLGYGGGVYDRVMRKTPRARHVGVCFEIQRLERLPQAPWDRPVDRLVTESQTY